MLAERAFGKEGNPPMIILHGLLGSSRNWTSTAKLLAEKFNVFALDLRNHGLSPHYNDMTFDTMIDDVHQWMLAQNRSGKYFLLGHSLGGKVAMSYALKYPETLQGLIVEDIAPKEYCIHYADYLVAMLDINLETLQSRHEAEKAIEATVDDWAMRQFLLTNLSRENGQWKWFPNLRGILNNLAPLMRSPLKETDIYTGPTFFIRGGAAGYIVDEDRPLIKKHFPRSALMTFKDGGHNIHIESPKKFAKAIFRYKKFIGSHPPFAIRTS